jgi:hypothetical protein
MPERTQGLHHAPAWVHHVWLHQHEEVRVQHQIPSLPVLAGNDTTNSTILPTKLERDALQVVAAALLWHLQRVRDVAFDVIVALGHVRLQKGLQGNLVVLAER